MQEPLWAPAEALLGCRLAELPPKHLVSIAPFLSGSPDGHREGVWGTIRRE